MCLATPSFGDIGPPKALERGWNEPRIRRLNGLIESHPGSILLIYADVNRIEVKVSSRFADVAEKHGFPGSRPGVIGPAMPQVETMNRNLIAGVALCLGCVTGGILCVRRRNKWTLGVVAVTTAAVVSLAVFIPRVTQEKQHQITPLPVTATTRELPIDVYLVDAGAEIRITLPKSFKPNWLGERNETAWPSPHYSHPQRHGPPKSGP